MTDTALYAELSELLREGGASELIKRMHSHYVSWDEFLAMRLPSRMSPEATWDLLKLVNRAAGIEIPIPDLAGNDYWYLRTHEVADAMARIQCLCRADSGLYLSLTATHNRRVLVRSRIDETIAAALLDGLEIPEKAGLSLLQHERTPRTDTERLVTNTLSCPRPPRRARQRALLGGVVLAPEGPRARGRERRAHQDAQSPVGPAPVGLRRYRGVRACAPAAAVHLGLRQSHLRRCLRQRGLPGVAAPRPVPLLPPSAERQQPGRPPRLPALRDEDRPPRARASAAVAIEAGLGGRQAGVVARQPDSGIVRGRPRARLEWT